MTLKEKINNAAMLITMAGVIGGCAGMCYHKAMMPEAPEPVAQVQQLEARLNTRIDTQELIESPTIGEHYVELNQQYETLKSDPEITPILKQYNSETQYHGRAGLGFGLGIMLSLLFGLGSRYVIGSVYEARQREEEI